MSSSVPGTSVPRAVLRRFSAPLALLGKLAVGPARWRQRLSNLAYQNDPDIYRATLWYEWALERARRYIETYNTPETASNHRRWTRPETWLERKHRTLKDAFTSGQLLPVDVADQVVRHRWPVLMLARLRR